MIKAIGQFKLYLAPSLDPGGYVHVTGRFALFLDRVLGLIGLHLCTHVAADRLEIHEVDVDAIGILEEVRDQLAWAARSGYNATKIVVGRDEFRRLCQDRSLPTFLSTPIPGGVPLIAGLELVVNPCIKGVVIG